MALKRNPLGRSVPKPETPFGYTIFCDDVRQEIRQKLIYIGVYTGDMVVAGEFPVTLPRLCMIATYCQRPTDERRPVKIKVLAPTGSGDEVVVEGDLPSEGWNIPIDRDAEDPIVTATTNIVLEPFTIAIPGTIKVRAYYGDEEIKLGSLQVRKIPTAEGSA